MYKAKLDLAHAFLFERAQSEYGARSVKKFISTYMHILMQKKKKKKNFRTFVISIFILIIIVKRLEIII